MRELIVIVSTPALSIRSEVFASIGTPLDQFVPTLQRSLPFAAHVMAADVGREKSAS